MDINKLKELRNLKTLSQRAFAAHLGVSQATIASWESGRTEPDNNMLKQIADYFNVTTDYLLGHGAKNIGTKIQPVLNEKQTRLINGYEKLNDEGQNMLLGILASLQQSHAKEVKQPRGIYECN